MPVRRSLSAFVSVGLLIAFTGLASAEKPRIAVLGLEAGLDNGVVDQATTRVAKTLTNGLRSHATSVRSNYQLAPSSNRELIDEKLMKSCDSEKPECMAPIGTELTAEFIMFGRVDKATEGGVQGYKIQIKLLDVKKRTEAAPWRKFVASSEATAAWAEDVYAQVTGEAKELPPTPPPFKKKDDTNWKTIGYVSGVTAVLLGGAAIASWRALDGVNYGEPLDSRRDSEMRCFSRGNTAEKPNCSCTTNNTGVNDGKLGCDQGTLLKYGTWIGGIGAAIAVGVTGVAIFKSSRSSSNKERSAQAGREVKRSVSVTPILAPDGGGATVRIDW